MRRCGNAAAAVNLMPPNVQRVLARFSRWNDRVQAWLFDPNRLAPTYPASAITKPFPFNAFYPVDDAPEIDGDDYALEVSGRVADKQSWTLAKLRALPQEQQITRLICIEGWSAIGQWSGVPLRVFLERIGADAIEEEPPRRRARADEQQEHTRDDEERA